MEYLYSLYQEIHILILPIILYKNKLIFKKYKK